MKKKLKNNLIKGGIVTISLLSALPVGFSNTYANGVQNDCITFDKATGTILAYSRSIECEKDVVIPVQIDGVDVTNIGNGAFSFTNINSIKFEEGSKITRIGDNAFSDNYMTGNVVFPSELETIGFASLSGNWFSGITFNDKLKTVGDYAFSVGSRQAGTGIGTIRLPESYEGDSWWTYWGSNYSGFDIPKVVFERTGLFYDDGLLYRLIPNDHMGKIAQILNMGIGDSVNIKNKVTAPDGVEYFTGDLSQSMFSAGLAQSNTGDRAEVNYSDGTTRAQSGLKSITINIDPEYSKRRGYFFENGLLFSTENPKKNHAMARNADYSEIGNDGLNGTHMNLLRNYNHTDDRKEHLNLPTEYKGLKVKGIHNGFNWLYNAKRVTLPQELEYIDINGFLLNELEEITLPRTLNNLVVYALRGNNLKTINAEGYTGNEITPYIVGGVPRKQYFVDGGIYIDYRGDGTLLYHYNADKTRNIIHAEVNGMPVKEIGGEAFTQLRNLDSVTIPNGIEIIGNRAFETTYYKSVDLGDTVKTIKHRAFFGNDLKTIDIPDSVETIEEQAFSNNIGIGHKDIGYKVIGIISDNKDKATINNHANSGIILMTRAEAEKYLDDVPPATTLVNEGNGTFKVNGHGEGEKSMYAVLEPGQTCPTTIREAEATKRFKHYDTTTGIILDETSNGKVLCVISYDINSNLTHHKHNIGVNEIDKTAPIINSPATKEIFVGTENVNLLDGITTNEGTTNDIRVVGNYDLSKVGTYNVELTQTDAAGNTTTKPMTIVVKEADKTELNKKLDEAKKALEGTNVINDDKKKALEDKIKEIEAKDKTNLTAKEIGDLINELNTSVAGLTKDTTMPIITETLGTESVKAKITDDNLDNDSLYYYFKGDEANKIKYTNESEIKITSKDSGKTLVIEATDKYGNKSIKEIPDIYEKVKVRGSAPSRGGSSSGPGGYVPVNDPRVSVNGDNGTGNTNNNSSNNSGSTGNSNNGSTNTNNQDGEVRLMLVDQLGNEIQPTIIHKGKVGESYDLSNLIPQLDGYEVKTHGNLTGVIGEKTKAAVIYQRLSDIRDMIDNPVDPINVDVRDGNEYEEGSEINEGTTKVKLPKTGAETENNKGLIAGILAIITATMSSLVFFFRRK